MELRQKIEDWLLGGCLYFEGVALYRWVQHGSYPVQYFEGYEGAKFIPEEIEKRLKYALVSALEKLPIRRTETTQPTAVSLQPLAISPSPLAEPETILQLREQAKSLHKTHALIHARMVDAIADEDRFAFASQIMEDIVPSLDAIYDKIRAWQDTGELPPATIANRDRYIIEKMLRRNSLKSRISRLTAMLTKKMPDQEKMKLEKELLEKEVELKEIEVELEL